MDRANEAMAFVPIYEGKNLMVGKTVEEIARMVLKATGKSGACSDYVQNVANQMLHVGIDDPAVTELCEILRQWAVRGQA